MGKVFLSAPTSSEIEKSLIGSLGKCVSDKSETETVNMLLPFVQRALGYRTDEEQFGKEKYTFVEQTLTFPFSDCEDRVFSSISLVKQMLGLEVVGLLYPNHMSAAVKFPGPVQGDSIILGDRYYVICNPAYIYANFGISMSQYKDIAPKVINSSSN